MNLLFLQQHSQILYLVLTLMFSFKAFAKNSFYFSSFLPNYAELFLDKEKIILFKYANRYNAVYSIKKKYEILQINFEQKEQIFFSKFEGSRKYTILINVYKDGRKEIGNYILNSPTYFKMHDLFCSVENNFATKKQIDLIEQMAEIESDGFFDSETCGKLDISTRTKLTQNFNDLLQRKSSELSICLQDKQKWSEFMSDPYYSRLLTGFKNNFLQIANHSRLNDGSKFQIICKMPTESPYKSPDKLGMLVVSEGKTKIFIDPKIISDKQVFNKVIRHELGHTSDQPFLTQNNCFAENSADQIESACDRNRIKEFKFVSSKEIMNSCIKGDVSKALASNESAIRDNNLRSDSLQMRPELGGEVVAMQEQTNFINQRLETAAQTIQPAQASDIRTIAEATFVDDSGKKPKQDGSTVRVAALSEGFDSSLAAISRSLNSTAETLSKSLPSASALAKIPSGTVNPTAAATANAGSAISVMTPAQLLENLYPSKTSSTLTQGTPSTGAQTVVQAAAAKMAASRVPAGEGSSVSGMTNSAQTAGGAPQARVGATISDAKTAGAVVANSGASTVNLNSTAGSGSIAAVKVVASDGASSGEKPVALQQNVTRLPAQVYEGARAPIQADQAAQLLTTSKMNAISGATYSNIKTHLADETFATILKQRRTVIYNSNGDRLAGDATTAKTCFTDTGKMFEKKKVCPPK